MSKSPYYSIERSPSSQQRRDLVHVTEQYACGDKYDGFVIAGTKTKHGTGKYVFKNGSVYDGDWSEGTMDGKGTFFEAVTRDRFEGIWSKGKRVVGVYYFDNGDLYIGNFDEETGHMKHGRSVVVDDMVPFDAIYDRDVIIHKEPFDGHRSVHLPVAHSHKETLHVRDVSQHDDQQREVMQRPSLIDAAKVILRSQRDKAATQHQGASPTHLKKFGEVQRGQFDRFESMEMKHAKDAYRFHYR